MPEYRINTAGDGKPQFVRARSFSHSHRHHMRHHLPHLHHGYSNDDLPHHHLIDHILPHDNYYRVEYHGGEHKHHHPRRPRCPINCACITRDEWANLVEQNRNYVALTKNLAADVSKLKKKADAAADAKAVTDKENQRLTCSNAELSVSLKKLQDENAELRRCLATQKKGDYDLIECLRQRARNQLAELDAKDAVVKGLETRVGTLKKEVLDLKHRLKHRHNHNHNHNRHGLCSCHSCSRKKDDRKDNDGSSSDDGELGGKSGNRSALRKKVAELSVSLALWQRKAEYAEKRARELELDCDASRAEVLKQTELADQFRLRVQRLEDRLGCRPRGVWFG